MGELLMISLVDDDEYSRWTSYMECAFKFLHLYSHLVDAYVLDYFTEKLWDSLPPQWVSSLEHFSSQDLAQFLNVHKPLMLQAVLPLSLLAFRKSSHAYSLNRKSVKSSEILKNGLRCFYGNLGRTFDARRRENNSECFGKEEVNQKRNLIINSCDRHFSWENGRNELSVAGGQHRFLHGLFRRHLKPKKQHEVVRLAEVASFVVMASCEGKLVDIGSGQGHLSRLLSYGYGVEVVCLDSEDVLVSSAKKFDLQLEKEFLKLSDKIECMELPPSPTHVMCTLDLDTPLTEFSKTVEGCWSGRWDSDMKYGVLGLHTCGDLGPALIRNFVYAQGCCGLVSVGCCYMKLSCERHGDGLTGYPMSNFVSSLENNELSYIAREMACHAIEMYSEKLYTGSETLKVHCYRAVLEEIIIKCNPSVKHAGLRSVNHAHRMPFSEYALKALSKLPHLYIPSSELSSPRTEHCLQQWMKVVIFYSIRLMLAPIVETVILLDRLFFLHEQGLPAVLVPVFDPLLSPRNFALICMK